MVLKREIIEKTLMGENTPMNVVCYDETDSTNNEAKRLVREGAELPLLIAADRQTAGRGRLGRNFYSPAGTGTYETVVFRPKGDLSSAVTVTSGAAVAVCLALERLCGLKPKIKWVNDVYLKGGKVCGILTESFTGGEGPVVAVGVGINLTTENFPEEISARAASVGVDVVREELIALVASDILKYSETGCGGFIDLYRERSMVVGKRIAYGPVGEEPEEAVAVGIDDEGGLIIKTDSGEEKTLRTGEITLRIK